MGARRVLAAGCIALVVLVCTPGTSDAALIMRLTEGGASVTLSDQSAADSNPVVGAITFIGTVGVFSLNVSTGLSKPVLPNTPTEASMDLNSVNLSTAAGTLMIELTDTFFLPFPIDGTLTGAVGGTTSGTVEFWAYKDPSNTEFGTSSIAVHLGPFTGPAFSGTGETGHGPLLDVYSMTLVASITHGSGTNTSSFDFMVQNIPEPAVVLLLGIGLIGVRIRHRRR